MYIVAIAWIFVTLLMALTETGFIAGILSFTFYGLLPLALFLWLIGTPQRRRNQASRSDQPAQAPPLAQETIDQAVGKPDRPNSATDQ